MPETNNAFLLLGGNLGNFRPPYPSQLESAVVLKIKRRSVPGKTVSVSLSS